MNTTEYRALTDGLHYPLRIALISDLHERRGDEVINILKKEKPDLIFFAGDMLERHKLNKKNPEVRISDGAKKRQRSIKTKIKRAVYRIFDLLFTSQDEMAQNPYEIFENCARIAPVFYSLGNHELYLTKEDEKMLKENHITLLDNQNTQILWKNQKINIGGLSTIADFTWLKRFSKEEGIKFLLCHHPEVYFKTIKRDYENIFDGVFCGHAHGGQYRIFDHGLYAPDQGLWPAYTKGKYMHKNKFAIISAGLADTVGVGRWNNPKEVVIVDCSNSQISN